MARKILKIFEDEAHNLGLRLAKGEKPKLEDFKTILKATGLVCGDSENQKEAAKKSIWLVAPMAMWAALTKKW